MGKTKRNEAAIETVSKMMDEAGLGRPQYIDHKRDKDATRLKYWVGRGNKEEARCFEEAKRKVLEEILPEMEAATGCKLEYYFRTALVHSYYSHTDDPERFLYIWVPDNTEAA